MSEDEYRSLQNELLENPQKGKQIRGSKGLRKIRCAIKGQGKSGSIRIIYYYKIVAGRIYMLYLYRKNEQSDLTGEQRRKLCALAERFENEK